MIAYVRSFFDREGIGQMAKLLVIGVVNTVVYFAMVNLLIGLSKVGPDVPLFWRVTVSFAVATEVSYLLNRRWTFGLKGGVGPWRETAVFFAVNAVAWAATVGIVLGAEKLFGQLDWVRENVANLVAGVVILLPKLASYRDLVFRRALSRTRGPSAPGQAAEPEESGVPGHLGDGPEGDPAA